MIQRACSFLLGTNNRINLLLQSTPPIFKHVQHMCKLMTLSLVHEGIQKENPNGVTTDVRRKYLQAGDSHTDHLWPHMTKLGDCETVLS